MPLPQLLGVGKQHHYNLWNVTISLMILIPASAYRIDPSLQGTNRLKRPWETEEVLIGSRAQPETQLALPRFPKGA